jgi:hypothetical protein
MKLPFRFFRGEFNGFYLYRALVCLNTACGGIVDELVYQAASQWKTAEETAPGELPIREDDLIGIGKIAGLFQEQIIADTSLGSVTFTESHVVNGKERSERGLLDMELGANRYARTAQDDYPDDIVSETSASRRMSFVPSGTEPIGYVAFGTDIYNGDGTVIWDHVLPEPPDDVPYTPFYGERFLVGEEWFVKATRLPVDVFKSLIECALHVRRNGPTIKTFFDVSDALVGGVVSEIELELMPERHYRLWYSVTNESNKKNQHSLLMAWLWMIRNKFKLFMPELR